MKERAAPQPLEQAGNAIKDLADLFEADPGVARLAAAFLQQPTRTEAARDQSPEFDLRYRTLVEQLPAVIFMAFLDRGISEAYVSPHIESVLGFSQREWLDDPVLWYRQIHPEDKERWSLEAAGILVSGGPLRSVYRVLARDGSVVWFQCEAKMVRDEHGQPWFIHGLGVDITELRETQERLRQAHEETKQRAKELEAANAELERQIAEREIAEKSLRESEEKFRLLVDGVKDYAIFMLAPDGRVASWNQGAERIKRYSEDEIIGEHFSKFYLEKDIERGAPEETLKIAQSEGRYEAEGWRRRKDGSVFWAHVSVTALTDNRGRLYGFAKVTRDMSEQKAMEAKLQESERLAAMGTTAAMFAHEVGNPLNAISTSLQYLQLQAADKKADPVLRESLESVMSEVYRLTSLLNDFRSLARPQQLDLTPTDIAQLVRELVTLHAAQHAERRITVKQEFPPRLPILLADGRRLKQAILNLLKNAMEAMPQGGTLTLRGRHSPGMVLLEIADTGVGIPEDCDIFQLFKTTKKYGTGLGLAIVRQIISAHDGTISYRSERGKGTTFVVSLPTHAEPWVAQDSSSPSPGVLQISGCKTTTSRSPRSTAAE